MNKSKKILMISLFFISLLIVATLIVTRYQTKIMAIYIKNYKTFSIDKFIDWEYYLGNATCTDFPYVDDFDGDGLADVLFRARNKSKIYVGMLNISNGKLKWVTELTEPHPYSSTYLDYGNFYNDPPLEIIIGVSNNIYLISGLNGSILANYTLPKNKATFSYIYAIDINEDGSCEAIYNQDNRLYIIDLIHNKLLWNISIESNRSLIAFHDVNQDGYKELFYTNSNGTIIGYSPSQGALWCTETGIRGDNIHLPIVFTNTNNTPIGIFIINNTIISVNTLNGKIQWTKNLSEHFKKIASLTPTIIDYDKDGELEIFIAGYGGENEFIALNENSEIEITINVLDEIIIPVFYSDIIINDIDSDNKQEIIGLSIYELYIIDLNDREANLIKYRYSLNPRERHTVIYHNGLKIIEIKGKKKIILTTLNHIITLNIENTSSLRLNSI